MKNATRLLLPALLAALLLPAAAAAQCCGYKRDAGLELFNQKKYEQAITKWQEGKNCSDAATACPDLDNLIAQARTKIKQRDQAAADQRRRQEAERQRQEQNQAAELQRLRDKADDDLWDVLKDGDAADCDKYLAKYPTGRHAKAAKDRKTALLGTTPTTSNNMVLITGGTYTMGDVMGDKIETDETPHTVTVGSFYLSKYEVTFDEFDAFCAATNREKPSDNSWGRGRRPAINVDWYDAVEYCNWRSARENLTPVYTIDKNNQDPNNQNSTDNKKWKITPNWSANGYRLPTEAEWEFAARAAATTSGAVQGGQKVRFGNGRDIIDPSEINFDATAAYKKSFSIVGEYRQKTVPVDDLSANKLGLKHLSGNVWEWCWDWYDAGYYAQSDGARNPSGPSSGQYRVCRGGSWSNNPGSCRSAYRNWDQANTRSDHMSVFAWPEAINL